MKAFVLGVIFNDTVYILILKKKVDKEKVSNT